MKNVMPMISTVDKFAVEIKSTVPTVKFFVQISNPKFEITHFKIAHVMLIALMDVMDATIEYVLAMNQF